MCKVLLVDDEHLEREALNMILDRNVDYVDIIGQASSGEEAVELTERLDPDIIFMDIKMPGMDGLEAARIIKEKYPDKKIIILTAYDDFSLAQKAIRIDVDDYVLKPIRGKKIIELLQKYYIDIENQSNVDKKNTVYMDDIYSKELFKAIKYIQNNFQGSMTLNDVANHVNLSTSYLSKLFKKELGMNFTVFLTDCRMERAKQLLEDTDDPIINISMELGYNESNYFSKVFRKKYGETPSKYRDRKKEERIKKLESNPLRRGTVKMNGKWCI
ncbi:response regulator transcription factor [Clostridiisalibacter paucivorans]|uniref:response regulator transcription factor n=1 Tax=Clostridiisalibacter paucivorans TaxID=408753 RepID=UPI0006852C20|nr:response regulator [Clostridiisalibacter paucivorans]